MPSDGEEKQSNQEDGSDQIEKLAENASSSSPLSSSSLPLSSSSLPSSSCPTISMNQQESSESSENCRTAAASNSTESSKLAAATEPCKSIESGTSFSSLATSEESKLIARSSAVVDHGSKINVKIKKPDLTIADFELCLSDSVDSLKQKLIEVVSLPVEHQRIIISGRLLQNNTSLHSYGISDGQTLFVLNNAPRQSATAASVVTPSATISEMAIASPSSATLTSNATATLSSTAVSATLPAATETTPEAYGQAANATSTPSIAAANNLFSSLSASASASSAVNPYQALMDLNPLGASMGAAFADPQSPASREMMSRMLNSSVVQDLMDNPEFLSFILESNPQLNELRQRNPELNHILNDPQMLRQSMELMRNPSLMREMMRSSDRAMSNIEAIPGGFNALRRMYHSIQEPMWNATVDGNPLGGQPSAESNSQSFDMRTNYPPNTEALPNPWAQQHPSAVASNTSSNAANLANVFSPQGMLNNQNPLRMGFDPNNLASMMNDPFMQNFAAGLLDDQYPMDARGLAASSSSTVGSSSSPNLPSNGGNAASGVPFSQNLFGAQNPTVNLPAMMQALRNMNLNSQAPTPSPSPSDGRPVNENPEVLYHSQLFALRNMGFTDTQACIRALQQSGGNLNRAIDRLLEGSRNP